MDEFEFRRHLKQFYTERYEQYADCPLYRGYVDRSMIRNARFGALLDDLWLPTYTGADDAVLDCFDHAAAFKRMLKALSPERQELLCGLYATGLIAIEAITRPFEPDGTSNWSMARARLEGVWPGNCGEYVGQVWNSVPALLSASERMGGWHPEVANSMMRERLSKVLSDGFHPDWGGEVLSVWAMAHALDETRLGSDWLRALADQSSQMGKSVREQVDEIATLWPRVGREDQWFVRLMRERP